MRRWTVPGAAAGGKLGPCQAGENRREVCRIRVGKTTLPLRQASRRRLCTSRARLAYTAQDDLVSARVFLSHRSDTLLLEFYSRWNSPPIGLTAVKKRGRRGYPATKVSSLELEEGGLLEDRQLRLLLLFAKNFENIKPS